MLSRISIIARIRRATKQGDWGRIGRKRKSDGSTPRCHPPFTGPQAGPSSWEQEPLAARRYNRSSCGGPRKRHLRSPSPYPACRYTADSAIATFLKKYHVLPPLSSGGGLETGLRPPDVHAEPRIGQGSGQGRDELTVALCHSGICYVCDSARGSVNESEVGQAEAV